MSRRQPRKRAATKQLRAGEAKGDPRIWKVSGTVTDNDAPAGKLMLRRHFMTKYHAEGRAIVLDCCQAGGVLWRTLRREFDVTYWGVDRIAKRGRLAVDSSRLLLASSLPYDVIDVDTYGSPWQHWKNMLPNIVRPTTVFLTLGNAGGIASIDSAVIEAVGLRKMSRLPAQALRWKLDQIAVESCLALCYHYGVRIVEAQQVYPPARNARYYGLRVVPPK
jgi:hypothetical protein